MTDTKPWMDNQEIVEVLKWLTKEVDALGKKVQELQEHRYKVDNQID